MKVLHISAADESTGAGKAALLTHNALLLLGINSKILFLKSNLEGQSVYSYHKIGLKYSLKRLGVTFLERAPLLFYPKRRNEIFSSGWIGLKLYNLPLVRWADVIHIHWANHGFVDIKEIEKWKKPVIWTLRDMWAFSGGCHLSFECIKYKYNCGVCPALKSKKNKDLSFVGLNRKIRYLRSSPITWVAISSWIKQRAGESVVLQNKNIQIVPSGINAEEFFLKDRKKTRSRLNLPNDKIIILIGAVNLREKQKGFDYVIPVLNHLNNEYLILTFGSNSFKLGEIPQQFIHFGTCKNDRLAELYSASDIFLAPSIVEPMGKTFLEAQFCGLPVVCFANTGPADFVKHKITGYLAEFKNGVDLLNGIKYSLRKKWNRLQIRNRAVQKFDISKVAKDYIQIYEKNFMDRGSI